MIELLQKQIIGGVEQPKGYVTKMGDLSPVEEATMVAHGVAKRVTEDTSVSVSTEPKNLRTRKGE